MKADLRKSGHQGKKLPAARREAYVYWMDAKHFRCPQRGKQPNGQAFGIKQLPP